MPIFRKVVRFKEIERLTSMAKVRALLTEREAELRQEAGAPYYAPVVRDGNFDNNDITLAIKWPPEEN